MTKCTKVDEDPSPISYDSEGMPVFKRWSDCFNAPAFFPRESSLYGQIPKLEELMYSIQIVPCDSDPTLPDTDGDGYDDISDNNSLTEDYYSFLDNNVYQLVCMDYKDYPQHKITTLGDTNVVSSNDDIDEFEFAWTGNGYLVTSVKTSKVIAIDVSGKVVLSTYVPNNINQLWEIVPYNGSNGIVIRNKQYKCIGDVCYSQYLCYSNGEVSVISSNSEATRFMFQYDDTPPFGYAYMSYLKWIDNGVLSSQYENAISNYLYNKNLSFSGVINGQKVDASTAAMKFGGFSSGKNSCGWVAIYNACILSGVQIHPSDIVWYLEAKKNPILGNNTLDNAKYGFLPNAIGSFFEYSGIRNSGGYTFGEFIELTLDLDSVIKSSPVVILCYMHSTGAHYVAVRWDSALSKYVIYNRYSNVAAEHHYDSITNSSLGTTFWTSDYRLIALYKIG